MKHAIQRIHFVGIGGAGMSGIAEVLHSLGYFVSGSDLQPSAVLHRLTALGIQTFIGHAPGHVEGADVVVISTAVPADNCEVISARARGFPVVLRAQMLAELMRTRQGIAIAGTHGKTTTTSLVTSVLLQAGLDPSFVIGGQLNGAGVNARLGQGEFMVVEADESDASFLHLSPVMAVVTNIDVDHMETYGHDLNRLKAAFVDFLHRMPFYGTAIVCNEDALVRDIVGHLRCRVVGYGFGADAAVRAIDVRAVGEQMHFTVQRQLGTALPELHVVLNLVGRHNVLNALAAIAVATQLGIADAVVLRALAGFGGVGRRFQRYGELALQAGGAITLIDDYGHHPVEVEATLAAARGAFAGRRLVLAFQPHRYTRTRDCFAGFVDVLAKADVVLLAQVYAAGEAPLVQFDGAALASALAATNTATPRYVGDIAAMPQAIVDCLQAGDVVLCMGAGSIEKVPARVVDLLQTLELATQEGRAL
jgi:UDP-N-acetylmuramate--alanine ligase